MPDAIAFDQWLPDLSSRINPTAEALGVVSVAGQYGPFPSVDDYGPPSQLDAFTKILLHFDGADGSTSFPDVAPGTSHTWTPVGNAQIDTAQSKFGGASGLFDGTGDFISAPDSADFTLGSGDWTIDLWFNCNAAGGTFQRLCGQSEAVDAPATNSVRIERIDTTNVIQASASNGTVQITATGTTQFTNVLNTGWHHVAFVRAGNILRLFIDGVQESGDIAFTGSVADSAGNFAIGARGGGSAFGPWTGWIDEFRLSVGIARWTANFTPPSMAYSFGGDAEGVVQGAGSFYDSLTQPHIFMGDATKLYHLEGRIAVDRSKAGGYAVGSSDTWQFAQFGNNVVAVTRNENPQVFEMIPAPIAFADLGGSPPTGATSVARVGDFLWLGKDFTVHWSAFNNIGDWVPDAGTQAGNQELDQERGEIMALVGLDYAAIFQERGIRRAIYIGPPVIWDFGQDYVEKARGCLARNAAVPFGRIIYYAADDGFYAFDGQSSTPIGYGKVDNYFARNLNYAFRHKVSVGIEPRQKLVVFGFPAGSAEQISELLIYSIQDGRWTHDVLPLEFLFSSAAEPVNVDNFDLLYPSNDLDDPNIDPNDIDSAVFDDRRIRLAAFQTGTHRMGLFTGPPRAATVDTKEFEPGPGRRALVTEIWPLGDMQQGNVAASIGYRRALPGIGTTFTNATQMNRYGFCPQRIDARFMRARLQLTAGADWRRLEGIHFTASPTGQR